MPKALVAFTPGIPYQTLSRTVTRMSEEFIWKWQEKTPASSQIRGDTELWIGARGGDPWVMRTLQSHRVDGKLRLLVWGLVCFGHGDWVPWYWERSRHVQGDG